MNKSTYSKTNLISLLKELEQKIGGQPKKKQWLEDSDTPSDMPVRMLFGNWTNFLKAAGYTPIKSDFTIQARLNSIAARKEKTGGNNKGGRIIDKSGYILIWMPKHPNAKLAGYIHEHRLKMSNKLGRPLMRHESVHHKNGDRSDNRMKNLELWSTMQPSGQRVIDKIRYAKEILSLYENPELLIP